MYIHVTAAKTMGQQTCCSNMFFSSTKNVENRVLYHWCSGKKTLSYNFNFFNFHQGKYLIHWSIQFWHQVISGNFIILNQSFYLIIGSSESWWWWIHFWDTNNKKNGSTCVRSITMENAFHYPILFHSLLHQFV